jgi:hypothetical protein
VKSKLKLISQHVDVRYEKREDEQENNKSPRIITFPRRLFLVEGVKDESDRGILRLNMKQNHGIEYCFFRTDGKREFIEAAFCPECNSNNVVFDITHDALIKALGKINKDLFM